MLNRQELEKIKLLKQQKDSIETITALLISDSKERRNKGILKWFRRKIRGVVCYRQHETATTPVPLVDVEY